MLVDPCILTSGCNDLVPKAEISFSSTLPPAQVRSVCWKPAVPVSSLIPTPHSLSPWPCCTPAEFCLPLPFLQEGEAQQLWPPAVSAHPSITTSIPGHFPVMVPCTHQWAHALQIFGLVLHRARGWDRCVVGRMRLSQDCVLGVAGEFKMISNPCFQVGPHAHPGTRPLLGPLKGMMGRGNLTMTA